MQYKKKIIESYFKKNLSKNFKVNVIDTGLKTMTGGRVKRLQRLLSNKRFFLTYGDGVSNVNIKKLLSFHKKGKKLRISSKSKITSLVKHLEKLLDDKDFFTPLEKKQSMLLNINNLIYKLQPNDKELRILASILSTLSKKNF